MKKISLLITVLMIFAVGCSVTVPGEKTMKNMNNTMSRLQGQHQQDLKQKSPVREHDGVYLGKYSMQLKKDRNLPAVFDKRIILTEDPLPLPEITKKVSELSGITVQLSPRLQYLSKESGRTVNENQGGAFSHQIKRDTEMSLEFQGELKKLLDNIASYYGAFWEWDGSKVYIYRLKTITYNLITSPGQVEIENVISNESTSESGTSETGGDKSIEGKQTAKYNYKFDIWGKTLENVKSMLSEDGKVVTNQSSGTVTVTDSPQIHAKIKQYVNHINSKLSRQVAISAKVYSFQANDVKDYGYSIKALFEDMNDKVSATLSGANVLDIDNPSGLLSAAILKNDDPESAALNQWGNSEAIIKALNTEGDVQLITSGSGITMNNQPLPIQNVNRQGYLKSSSTTLGETDTTTELEGGMITTGFSLSATPHILENNKVVLQYNITLSKLENLKDIESGDSKIQLPETTSRNFMQQVTMRMGETLFLAGFQKNRNTLDSNKSAGGLFGWQKSGHAEQNMVLIAITVNEVAS